MLDIFFERFRQKRRTVIYPDAIPDLPVRFKGRPFIHADRCVRHDGRECIECLSICPVKAITSCDGSILLDMGKCTFCGMCSRLCPKNAIEFTQDWRLASTEREGLVVHPLLQQDFLPEAEKGAIPDRWYLAVPAPVVTPTTLLDGMLTRSLRLRQVSAAGCQACEADLNVLTTIVFDLSRFGIDFVASPRHADGLMVTGPVPRNMSEALYKCHLAVADPKVVIAVGSCAISGGMFVSAENFISGQNNKGVPGHLDIDLYIPGCPPHPYTSLDGLLRFLGMPVCC